MLNHDSRSKENQFGCLWRQRSLGSSRPVSHRGKHPFDRIGGAQVDSVLIVAILDEAIEDARILHGISRRRFRVQAAPATDVGRSRHPADAWQPGRPAAAHDDPNQAK
jgi:hypothetical protein